MSLARHLSPRPGAVPPAPVLVSYAQPFVDLPVRQG
ncbi:hypothetical protein QFZ58_006197 [Streptomyces sp. B1I3]|nr:hypothetical protein [Streptomyces sp. B1I3]